MNIKELAMKIANEMDDYAVKDWPVEFATRLFAARDAEAVPVAWLF